eukprot:4793410-Amphidinium_carterae.1
MMFVPMLGTFHSCVVEQFGLLWEWLPSRMQALLEGPSSWKQAQSLWAKAFSQEARLHTPAALRELVSNLFDCSPPAPLTGRVPSLGP